ncbi:glutathione S-transferase family protein [Radicibacter daui]|uniref:glutathione S-transferase family protein n=1 Tax=Radicibacter daui TaxID=3064829 RepID=UPI004046B7B6
MLELYAFATPNSLKPALVLEELGLDYRLIGVNVRAGEQKSPGFAALNPNQKVPVLVDADAEGGPLALSESAAILVYLAEKTGRLLPAAGAGRARVFEQLFFHASGLSPAFGNAGWFRKSAPSPQPIAIERFGTEALRLIGLLDARLAAQPYMAGDELTIADLAHFGWFWRRQFAEVSLEETPNLQRWYQKLEERPAVQRAISRLSALATG